MRPRRFFLVSILVPVLLQHTGFAQQLTPPPAHIPQGWYVYPSEKLKNADENTLRCFNYSQNEWQVMNEGNSVKITDRYQTGEKQDIPQVPSLPPLLRREAGMPGRTVDSGLRSALHFKNGWLLAYNAGEWGGGLWLTNEDGSKTKRILSDNVRAVIPTDSGILVLSGLAHLAINFGNAFIFSEPNGLDIVLQRAVALDGEPSAPAKEADGSVLFVTTYGLCRITKSGELERLTYFPNWTASQYPNSMAITPDGTIFIGMRMFVLKLQASSSGYSGQWLLPDKCRSFSLQQSGCVCHP